MNFKSSQNTHSLDNFPLFAEIFHIQLATRVNIAYQQQTL